MIVDLLLNNAKAYLRGEILDCSLASDEGKIWKIGRETNMPKADTKTDLRGLLVLPGLIDAHVHLRDEEKAYKEDFLTGTSAAAAGGFTTVLDMPNNEPVTMSPETLKNRMAKAERKILVNVGFFSEFPKSLADIERIANEGAVAFKLFMGQQMGGLDLDDDSTMLEGFKNVAALRLPVAVHAEDKKSLEAIVTGLKAQKRDDIDAYLEAHSEEVELKAVEHVLVLSKQTGLRIHFCHVSTKRSLEAISETESTDQNMTCEVTPHNLLLSSDDFRRIGTSALTMPPIRETKHKEALWQGIRTGRVDSIGSDHAPHTIEEKNASSIWNVKSGIPGLETTLPILLTEVKRGRLSIGDIVRLLAERPAMIYGLKGKGSLTQKYDADLTIVDLKRSHRIEAAAFKSKAKYSPFDGWAVIGKAVKTFVGGQLVFDEGEIIAEAGSGQVIRRTTVEVRG